jgi:hypothetical protein
MKDEGGRMKEEPQDLRVRTRQYAWRVVALYGALPKSVEARGEDDQAALSAFILPPSSFDA